jgi:phosphinothricin acetyltransferase
VTADRIRLAAAGDFEAIAAITNPYIRDTSIHFGDSDVAPDELRSLWLRHADLYPWLVTVVSDRVVGYAKAGEYRSRAAYRWTAEAGIYLLPDQRGRGLGRPLYARLCAVLGAQGFHSVIGGITLPNPASVRLHEGLGFVHCGTVRRAGHKFGAWHDVGFWQLLLQPEGHAPGALLAPAAAFAATA